MTLINTLKYKACRAIQTLLNNDFVINFGQKSRVLVSYPPGNILQIANDPKSLDDLEVVLNNIQAGQVFFDVGANYGYFSLAVHDKCDGNISIHCFEPESKAYDRLLRNRDLNNGSWKCNKVGVGKEPGVLKITSSHGGFNHIAVEGEEGEECQVITLDSYIQENKIYQVDFLKVDVEGFEMNVLEGAKSSFGNKLIKKVLLENDQHQSRYGFDYDDFSSFFKRYDYKKIESKEKSNFEVWSI